AFASEEVMPTVSVAVVTRFQLTSTALTVTLKAVPALWAVGAPVLPVPLPGEAVSPGTSICSLANAPGFTVTDAVAEVLVPSVMLVATTDQVPAVLLVRLNELVPLTNALLAGSTSLGSLHVMPTVFELVTRFQLASTARTVTL